MDKEFFISCYKKVLFSNRVESKVAGLGIITSYIEEEGTDFHKQHISEFIPLLEMPPVYKHCLQWALDYYINKFLIIVVTLSDPNATQEHIITVY